MGVVTLGLKVAEKVLAGPYVLLRPKAEREEIDNTIASWFEDGIKDIKDGINE